MTRVVDANVILYALLDERRRALAFQALEAERPIAPDFLSLEVGHVLTKYVRSQAISLNLAKELYSQVSKLVDLKPSMHLASSAFDLALQHQHSIYDCLYLALAINARCSILTADRRLAKLVLKLQIKTIEFT